MSISVIYVEREVRQHPRSQIIINKFPRATIVECDRYSEVFNRRTQNFRLQKQRPSLILANKHQGQVMPAPAGYSFGCDHNYYFSHMLNCIYDCRYCFLQGMYRSANYVVFVNYEDFVAEIDRIQSKIGQPTWFFSGYDGDSLAWEPVTGFVEYMLEQFRTRPECYLELRTKSTQVRTLLSESAMENVVVAMSLSPQEIIDWLEHKTPSLDKRLKSLQQCQQHGWPIGLRIDPVIGCVDYRAIYRRFFQQVFNVLDPARIHSVTLGNFRLPNEYFKRLKQLYPDEPLLASSFEKQQNMVSYPSEIANELRQFCLAELIQYISCEILYLQDAA